MPETLTWEHTFAIACLLLKNHPRVNLEQVSLKMVYEWTIALPEFDDDRELANDGILAAIYQEWFEEVNPV